MLPCSISFIQGSDRCLSFEGLPEEAFEHLTNLNYLYLANNKVRGAPVSGAELWELSPGPFLGWPLGPNCCSHVDLVRPHTLMQGIRMAR